MAHKSVQVALSKRHGAGVSNTSNTNSLASQPGEPAYTFGRFGEWQLWRKHVEHNLAQPCEETAGKETGARVQECKGWASGWVEREGKRKEGWMDADADADRRARCARESLRSKR